MNKDLELLEEIKKAPAFMGGNPRYSNNLQSSIPFMEDIAVIERRLKALAIIKKKLVNVSILRSARNLKDYNNFGAPNVIDALKLTQEEFDFLREAFWK